MRISDWSSDVCSSDLAFALLSTLKAWVGYQALAAAVAREAGATDAAEARHFDSIVNKTRRDFERDLGDVTQLLGTLTRELRSAARRVGKEGVRTGRSGWSQVL